MTLVKTKPHRPTTAHKQRMGQHHHHGHSYIKAYWPYLPILAVLTLGLFTNGWLNHLHRDVLGYATDMSVQSLLSDTNAQRNDNGENSLNLNAELDTAAQNKASDMAARNYWSHDTPTGQTPWSFITAAGYNYHTAGENLAYGFASAGDTLTAWMNSPEHRANILNTSYKDIGFGLINIPNYQNSGPETLVVAMYGSPANATVAAAAPVTPSATSSQPRPAPSPSPSGSSTPSSIATAKPSATKPSSSAASDTLEPAQQSVSRIQLVSDSQASWSILTLVLIGLGALIFIIFRHGLAWHKALVRGERFALHHPMLDVLAVSVVTVSIILSHTSGLIR